MRPALLAVVPALALATMGAGCSSSEPAAPTATPTPGGTTATPGCTPLETRPRNAPEQEPAFPEQTRACAEPTNVAFDVYVVRE